MVAGGAAGGADVVVEDETGLARGAEGGGEQALGASAGARNALQNV